MLQLMWIKALILSFFVFLAACAPMGGISAPAQETPIPHNAERIRANIGVIEVAVNCPPGWQAYTDDNGLALAESPSSVVEGGALHGMLLYMWMPQLDEFAIPASGDINLAQAVLSQVIERPDYVGEGQVTEPQPFLWGEQHAAYYLLNDASGHTSFVLAVTIPRTNDLLALSISAPNDHSGRIRELLPTLLDGMTVNRVMMDSGVLDSLPQTLAFPQ